MPLNANLILAGNQPNFLAQVQQGNQAAAFQNQSNRTNDLANFNQANGAAVMRGDQNALNGYARVAGPEAAMGMQATRQGMAISAEYLEMAKTEAARQAEAEAADISAEEAAAASGRLKEAWTNLAVVPDEATYNALAQNYGIDPNQAPFAERELNAAKAAGYIAVLDAKTKANPPADVPGFDDNSSFRKEFNGIAQVKAFSEQAQAFGRIEASASDPSPAGDLALIFNFMKVLDPGSVVRESEFATAENASAWLQESEQMGVTVPRPVANAIRRMATGERLSDEQRSDFVGRAKGIYGSAERGFDGIYGQYSEIAKRSGLKPEDVLIDYRYKPKADDTKGDGSNSQILPEDIQALHNEFGGGGTN